MLLILGYALFVVLCIYRDASIAQLLERNVGNVEWKITAQAFVGGSSRGENFTVTQMSNS